MHSLSVLRIADGGVSAAVAEQEHAALSSLRRPALQLSHELYGLGSHAAQLVRLLVG